MKCLESRFALNPSSAYSQDSGFVGYDFVSRVASRTRHANACEIAAHGMARNGLEGTRLLLGNLACVS